jgi:hypothetical protein
MSVPAPHVRGINRAIEGAIHGVIFRAALGFNRNGGGSFYELVNRVVERVMYGEACHVKAYVKKLRHHALNLQHGSPSRGSSVVPVAAPIVWAVFKPGAKLG